ncbi:ABC transporter substrate-binding protein [Tumidithrix elongata RA019]|uniref:ABC transporter substrate-binding protein n=1 Tax=Tumidithrix elongata BACA0141 TaxID=2716417 RepID=A0AAW9Q4X9_9CYAN|nr:ABC transporter substrate-binding protein [Tumidithrix elongata RA019]
MGLLENWLRNWLVNWLRNWQERKWRLGFWCVAVVCGLIVANCQPTNQYTNPSRGDSSNGNTANAGVLVYGSGGQPVNLEPGNFIDGNSAIAQQQIYDRLIAFKDGTVELEPSLAESWTGSEDGKVWLFKLRQGVKFHDGSDFDAAAVKFNVERWWDPQHPQGFRNAGKNYEIWKELFGGFKGEPESLLREVEAVDRNTVKFTLNQAFAAFPTAIASNYFGIASPKAIQQMGASYGVASNSDANSIAVGTGAFRLKEWRTGDRIAFVKNPNYWQKDLPKSEQMVMRFVIDPAARLAQLRATQLDFTVDLAPDQRAEIVSDPNLDAVARPSFNVGYLALNPSYQPLSNPKVRMAIAQAINRKAIVKAFWGDLGISDSHFLPPSLAWAQSSTLGDYEYNPQKAKQLLAEAGYANGFELELWYMPVSRPYFPTPKPIAEAFAADLSAVGIRVSLKTKDWAAYLNDRNKAPGFQSYMMGWTADYGDPDNFYYPHFAANSTKDLGGWKQERLIQLLDRGRAIADIKERAQVYAEVDEILYREVVRIPIVHSQPLLAKRKALTGWIPSPLGVESFATVAK